LTPTEQAILDALEEHCEVTISPKQKHRDLMLFDVGVDRDTAGIDSLAALELVVFVAKTFNVQLQDAPKEAWVDVKTLAKYIDEHAPADRS